MNQETGGGRSAPPVLLLWISHVSAKCRLEWYKLILILLYD